ncbi:MAG: hypothetical protein Q4A32_10740 [Lachnospiraceae bacterium]|nr:hypothetical protein [Lachnospiraceae bacterium]
MKTRDLLEQNKERILVKVGSAEAPAQAVVALEDELGRIQIQYEESETDEALAREASYALQTTRAALSLIDSAGEIRTYDRTASSASNAKGKYLVPAAGGLGAGAAGMMLLAMAPAVLMPLGLIFVIAGLGLAFAGGYRFGRRGHLPERSEQIVDVRMDGDKIYRNLAMVLTVVDHNLEDARLEQEHAEKDASSPDDVDDDELRLLSSLLETACSAGGSEEGKQMISDISFYLHKRGIEVVWYANDTAKYFNRMPAAKTSTLKPALVRDNVVLIRGMAAVGR